MIVVRPDPVSEPDASRLAALRATALGQSLEADPAEWRLEETRVTAYATHYALTRGRAELRAAIVDGVVAEEDWCVRSELEAGDAGDLEYRLSDLVSTTEHAADVIEDLLAALQGSPDDSGAHPSWALKMGPMLAQLQDDVADVGELLRRAEVTCRDAADALAEEEEP